MPYRASCVAARHDRQRLDVGLIVGLHIDRPANAAPARARSRLPLSASDSQVVAVEQDGHVRLHAGHQLIDPHLDRLREAERHAGHLAVQRGRHFLDQLVARLGPRPLVYGLSMTQTSV